MATPVLSTSPLAPAGSELTLPRRGPFCGPRGRRAMKTAALACRLLRRRGWSTSLAGFQVAGDVDVRLCAVHPDSPVAVEVLCPCPDTPDDAGAWAAVRVLREERAVWCGPDLSCTVETLERFIDDLARRSDDELAQRYRCCG